MTKVKSSDTLIGQNRRARFDYTIITTLEAGLVLTGSEVKTLRLGQVSLTEAFADERNGELYLLNMSIPEYTWANRFNHEPKRPRKLLLHRRQINKFMGAIHREGMTLVPLKMYFNAKGIAKVELGLAQGKKTVDKRDTIKERDWQRSKARILRHTL